MITLLATKPKKLSFGTAQSDAVLYDTFALNRVNQCDTNDSYYASVNTVHNISNIGKVDDCLIASNTLINIGVLASSDSVLALTNTVYNVSGTNSDESTCLHYTFANVNAVIYDPPPVPIVTYTGSGRGITIDDARFAVGTGDFAVTISAHLNVTGQVSGLFSSGGVSGMGYGIEIFTDGFWRVGSNEAAVAGTYLSKLCPAGDHDYVFQRKNGVLSGWIDGVAVTGSATNTRVVGSSRMCLGARYGTGTFQLNASSYVSNFAFYTSALY